MLQRIRTALKKPTILFAVIAGVISVLFAVLTGLTSWIFAVLVGIAKLLSAIGVRIIVYYPIIQAQVDNDLLMQFIIHLGN